MILFAPISNAIDLETLHYYSSTIMLHGLHGTITGLTNYLIGSLFIILLSENTPVNKIKNNKTVLL